MTWDFYNNAPIEIKIIFYIIVIVTFTIILATLFRKGIIYGKLKFGGKDRYLTAKETIEAIQRSFSIIEERADIRNNLRIKDQLDYADQENTFIREALIKKFDFLLKKTDRDYNIRQKSLKNYQLVANVTLKEIVHMSRNYYKGIPYKESEEEIKREIQNPNSEISDKIERRSDWSLSILRELLNKHYNENDIIPIEQIHKENQELYPELRKIFKGVVVNAYEIHGKYNDRLKELNNALDTYINKLSE